MNADQANQLIASFGKRFGQAHLYLAYHAAVPLALTPDLLYRLWANFQRDNAGVLLGIPWVAVADLLLSGLCRETRRELYEMDTAVRSTLINRLRDSRRFGPLRINELADFLLDYLRPRLSSPDPLTRAQRWTALAFSRPDQAAKELALAVATADWRNTAELLRLMSVIETFDEPLSANYGAFLSYARGLASYIRGDRQVAQQHLSAIGSAEAIDVAGVSLTIPQVVLRDIRATEEHRASSASEPTAAQQPAPRANPYPRRSYDQPSNPARNPYIVGGMTRGHSFYGRAALIQQILNSNSRTLWVVGGRRMGKTSLLRRLEEVGNSDDRAAFHISLEAADTVAELRGYLRDELNSGDGRLEWIGLDSSDLRDKAPHEMLRLIDRRARDRGIEVLLLLDEAESLIAIAERDGKEMLTALRQALDRTSAVRVVFAATKRLLAIDDLLRSGDTTPFLDGLEPVYLGPLERDEALGLIRQSQAATPQQVAAQVAEAILAAAGGHPFLLQWLCLRLWDAGSLRPPSADDLLPDDLIDNLFRIDYGSLAPAERRILHALAAADTLDERTLLARVGGSIPEPQLRYLIQSLIRLGYVRRVGKSYAVGNQLLLTWLRSGVLEDSPAPVSDTAAVDQADQDQQAVIGRAREIRRRLRLLEEQQAIMGISTPTEVVIEIEDLRASLAALDQELIRLRSWQTAVPVVEEPVDEEAQARAQLINSHRRRLQLLKQRQTVQGAMTPPEIIIEIEDIERRIAELEDTPVEATPRQTSSAASVDQTDEQHITSLIDLNRRRRQILQEQQAVQGYSAPAELAVEIESINDTISQLQQRLKQVETRQPIADIDQVPADEQRRTITSLIVAHRRRLRVLEERQAISGRSTPAEIQTEIHDLRSEIARLEGELANLQGANPSEPA